MLLNLAGYCEGKLIPFSVKTNVWLPLEPEPLLPGLYEAIVGQVPSEGLVVDITLPDDYPVEPLRGAPARFLVHIQAAREVTYPDLESPEFLQAFGRGTTIEEATQSVIEQMKQEHTQLLLLAGPPAGARRGGPAHLGGDSPDALVDEEIRRRWGATEGALRGRARTSPTRSRRSRSTPGSRTSRCARRWSCGCASPWPWAPSSSATA